MTENKIVDTNEKQTINNEARQVEAEQVFSVTVKSKVKAGRCIQAH